MVNTKPVLVRCHGMIWEVVFETSAGRQTSRRLEREEGREGKEGKDKGGKGDGGKEGKEKSAGKQTDS